MKIEVWSDFVCPFCYIGKRRLEEALAQFPHRKQIEVEYKSFELDSQAPKDSGKSMSEILALKYGMSKEEAQNSLNGMAEQAATAGLTFRFETMIPTNTLDAHRLAKYAKTKNKEEEITERILYAYFTESKHIGEHETLADLAEEIDLNREEVLAVLQDEQAYVDEVRADQSTAQQIGVRGVPFFVINNKYALSGAQPPEVFFDALQKAWAEAQQASVLQDLSKADDGGGACTDGSCGV